MKLLPLLVTGTIAIGLSALVSNVAQNSMSGRVAATPAPTLEALDARGKPVTLQSTLKGRKLVLVNFWFSACGVCREEFPHLEKLYRRFKPQGLEILAVNSVDDAATAQKYWREKKWSFPYARDTDQSAALAYKVEATPANFLVDESGSIIWKGVGSDPEGLRRVLEETLSS
jgi:peroxiredoxin